MSYYRNSDLFFCFTGNLFA